MAKYEDYVKQELDTEIDEAAKNQEQRQQGDSIPERFKGKSAEEIARSFVELESLYGKQAQQYGDLRKTVENLEKQIKPSEPAKPAPEKKPVTVDEIYDNADDAVRRVVREESQSRIEELERKLQEAERRTQINEARKAFEQKHPDYTGTMKDPAFIEWIKASPFRVRMAQAADAGDFDAADELFSTYADISVARTDQNKQSKRSEVRKAGLVSSGGTSPAPVEKYDRIKLESMRIAARRGDREAEAYLRANSADILTAYAEGRIIN
jgi:polyhydroxyalkanoate synthesis regulator phasin